MNVEKDRCGDYPSYLCAAMVVIELNIAIPLSPHNGQPQEQNGGGQLRGHFTQLFANLSPLLFC